MIRILTILSIGLLSIATTTARAEPASVTMSGLLNEMTDYDAIARWPEPAFTVRQASSYDRSRIAPDKPGWFANEDKSNFIRIEQNARREERVMLDAAGPGAIVRFFLTNGDPLTGHIRVYLDGADTPAIEWPVLDLTKGDLSVGVPLCAAHPPPLNHGGSTLYLPIPYAKHCKVTLEEGDAAHAGARYYHIDYRTYAAGTAVEAFTGAAFASARPTIDRANELLAKPPSPKTTTAVKFDKMLKPGETKSVDLPAGSMAIKQLELSVAADLPAAEIEQLLRSTNLHATFDDEPEAINCSVGDFIGSGAGGFPVTSWYRNVDNHHNAVSRWTMPYHKGGKLAIENTSKRDVPVKLVARLAAWDWDDRSMYFHATFRQQLKIPARPFIDWNFLTATGRGVVVGDVMSVFNPIPSWYGEGDEKIWVDGESFPSHVGTGTEDYYNASWAPNPVFQTPFANHPRMDEARSQGQNVYTRSRNLDTIPFTRSLKFDFEIETWKESEVDYSTTTYWYGSPGARSVPHS